jgi:hypothetical protein
MDTKAIESKEEFKRRYALEEEVEHFLSVYPRFALKGFSVKGFTLPLSAGSKASFPMPLLRGYVDFRKSYDQKHLEF